MSERLDVAGRLAEGLPALEHIQTYVRACGQAGYQHPELTGDPAQVSDLYAGEEGLDLNVLDGDCAALRAAAAVIAEALRLQRDQLTVLATAWTGSGADSAIAFLRRHCDIASAVVNEVRAAAQRCESLRDNLWRLVDAKVSTTTAIDGRTAAQRPVWLAAAAALTTDAGAREVIDRQVKPYVDNDIRHDWRSAMLSAQAGVAAAYDMVTDRFAAAPRAHFEMPGDFGEYRGPAAATSPLTPAALAALPGEPVPARFAAAPLSITPPTPAPAPPMSVPAATMSAPAAGTTQPDLGAGWPGDSGLSGGGGGFGSGGGFDSGGGLGGLGGLASRIVAGLGDLLKSSAGDAEDDLTDDEGDRQEPDPLKEPAEPEKPESAQSRAHGVAPATPPLSAAQPAAAVPAPATPPAAAPPVGAPPVQPPAAAPVAAGSTPCEIAANELPQAGQ
ncbi:MULTISPECIES: hypothetical protein [unclassified Mycobacterium]|uniref:hypothetical protein n=1 Tax=unclassified Mycobacterium TaxID=2642494 RepID=UPI00274121C3|nr:MULTISPECIES: hypothetical protein [unclassified Mycobacterium]MDP7703782.1 hypothetical protein [Mycobacterium sp. TY815]MDP7722264.1 hypothetical protein [Mycobacterium sp. TY814]